MRLMLSEQERAELQAAQRSSRNVRHWRRYQAVLLRADGVPLATVATTLGCTQASVWNWTRAWRERGARGVAEGVYPGAERRLGAVAERTLEALREEDHPPGARLRLHELDGGAAAHGACQAGVAGARADAATHVASAGLPLEAPQVCAGTARSGGRGEKKPWQSKRQRW
jgi:transposase